MVRAAAHFFAAVTLQSPVSTCGYSRYRWGPPSGKCVINGILRVGWCDGAMAHAATRLHFGFGRNAVDVERQPERQLAFRLL